MVGGITSFLPIVSNKVVVFENNTNNGSIEGSFEKGSLYVGGVIGQISPGAEFSLCGNANNALINVSSPDDSSENSCIGGIVGQYVSSTVENMMTLIGNANYGDLVGQCEQKNVAVCGLFCNLDSSSKTKYTINNCVNHGNVESSKAYGISDVVTNANNVVNIGKVSGTSESFSFWRSATTTNLTSLYGLEDTCIECDNMVLIKKNTTDKHYRTMNNDSIVDTLLNEECENKGYVLRWDHELKLRRKTIVHVSSPINLSIVVLNGIPLEESDIPDEILKYHLIPKGMSPTSSNEFKKTDIFEVEDDEIDVVPYHLVTIDGVIVENIYLEADDVHYLGNISNGLLEQYFYSEDYVVGSSDTNTLLDPDDVVEGDINVVVMKENKVVIEIEESTVLAGDAVESVIAESLSALTGIDKNSIIVFVEVDSEGYVLKLDVFVKDNESCETVAKAVEDLPKDNCTYGVVCYRVRISADDLSYGVRIDIEYSVLLMAIFISIILTMMK